MKISIYNIIHILQKIFVLQYVSVLNCFSGVWLLETAWTAACQAPPCMGFSRQQHWSGLLCSQLGNLPDPGIELKSLMSPALACRFFTTSATWEAISSVQFSSFALSCPTLCDPMNHSTPGLPVHHQLLEFAQTHAHWVGDAIQPFHPLLSPSLPATNPSQNQGLFQWVNSLHEVAKELEFQLQHQSFQWTPRTDIL